ncbi:unnamed protein product [Penicillium pancosmium]
MTLAAPNLRSGGMPNLASPSRSLSLRLHAQSQAQRPSRCSAGRSFTFTPRQPLAHPRHGILHEPWLSPAPSPAPVPASATPLPVAYFSPTWVRTGIDGLDGPQNNNHKPPDKRVLKLGKTLRTLSPLLPTILYNTLPPEILAPNVNLHLFPSTHPHLPTVKGRTLYRAALWTVPVAWSSVPLVGNVKLQILSERIVRAGTLLDPEHGDKHDCGDERLVVRWKTEPRTDSRPFHESHTRPSTTNTNTNGDSSPTSTSTSGASQSQSHLSSSESGTNRGLSKLLGGDEPIFKLSKEQQFSGLFVFSFDDEGRVLTHTIEHADDATDGEDRTAKFVTLTDWLIGKARGSLEPAPRPGLCIESCHGYGLGPGRSRHNRGRS